MTPKKETENAAVTLMLTRLIELVKRDVISAHVARIVIGLEDMPPDEEEGLEG